MYGVDDYDDGDGDNADIDNYIFFIGFGEVPSGLMGGFVGGTIQLLIMFVLLFLRKYDCESNAM